MSFTDDDFKKFAKEEKREDLMDEQTNKLLELKKLITQLNKELKDAKYGKMRVLKNIIDINNGIYD